MSGDQLGESFVVAPEVIARSVGGETVIVDLESEHYFSLNATGAVVWECLSGGGSPASAVATLIEQFEVEEVQATADVAELVGALLKSGLLRNAT